MAYTIKDINGCTKEILFNFDSLNLTEEIDRALVKKQKEVNLKGFRKGKAPLAMVREIYEGEIKGNALNNFIQEQLYAVIDEEDFRPVGQPQIKDVKYQSEESLSFAMTMEIFPQVEVGSLSQYSFTVGKVKIDDEDLENYKNNFLQLKAKMVPVEEGVLQEGQFAVLNFQGEKEDGSRPESLKGEEFFLEVGGGNLFPEFEKEIVGMKLQEKKTLELTIPSDYEEENLRDCLIKFDVELVEIKEKKYPELTDELVKKFGFDSLEKFNEINLENLKKRKEDEKKKKLHQDILEKLVEDCKFDIPLALVAEQESHLREEMKKILSAQNFNENMVEEYFAKWEDDLLQKAQFQVRSGLILDSLAKRFEVEISDSDFHAKIEDIAGSSVSNREQIEKYYKSHPKMKDELMYSIREEKTFKEICQKIQVVEK